MQKFFTLLTLSTLAAVAAHAQQPALPSAPQPPASPLPPAPLAQDPGEIIGQTYSVELRTGTSFIGVLRATTAQDLTFDTRELGTVTVQRANLRQLVARTGRQASLGFDDVGNSTRMFFAPTARNLRKGEGYVQDIDIYLAGVNYGFTDHFSVGLLVPIIPAANFFAAAITPKVSVPVADKFSVGAGVLYAVATGFGESVSGGVGYGLATYGTADSNVTFGLGYGFAQGDVSSSPVAVVGGNLRVSRRLFLVDETYIASGGFGGLLGVRVAASRASGSIGVLYSSAGAGNFTPAYLEFAYRFGKVVSLRR